MSGDKKYFEDFSQIWPKGAFAKPVMGERGKKDLPSGTEGGEELDLERHYEHKQHTFDRFCKTTIKHEAFNAFRQIRNQQDRFVPLSELPEEAREQLATYDIYPWEYTTFSVEGEVILIKDDALADALNALPQDHRDILLMYWFLQMADCEIGEKLNLPRRTVSHRRQRAYELLKKLMGVVLATLNRTRKNRTGGKIEEEKEKKENGKEGTQIYSGIQGTDGGAI